MGFSNISEIFPGMRTVYVRFDGTPNKVYAYLYQSSMVLSQGDLVVVPTKDTFALATVVSTIEGMTDMAQRLVYCKIYGEHHKWKETKMADIFNKVQGLKKNAEISCNVSCLNENFF